MPELKPNEIFETGRIIWSSVIILTFLVLFNGLVRGPSTFWSFVQLSEREEQLEEAVRNLEQEKAAAADEILKIKTSPIYASKLLKDRYHYRDNNETMIMVSDSGLADLDHMQAKDSEK